jgi:small subunit ribosomal protein S6
MFAAISAYLLHGLSHLFLDFRRDLHMPLYESTLIARPDISGQQVEGLSEQFQEIVREKGGEVAKTEYWGLRSLTYKIKKNRKGHYLFMQIDAPAEAIAEMERNMRINEDVMRYLTIRIDALDPEPSVVMQSRGSRDSRGRGEYRSRDGERGEGRRDGPRDAPRADAPKDDGKAAAASATGAASVENSDSNAKSGAE